MLKKITGEERTLDRSNPNIKNKKNLYQKAESTNLAGKENPRISKR